MPASADSPIKTQVKTIDGLSVRYAESEPREVSAILLSPWPESLYTFEQMWSRLAEHAHLVAIDLPGFGQSQRRGELLKSSTMGEFVAHAVEAPDLEALRQIDPHQGVDSVLAFVENYKLPEHVHQDFLQSYEGDRFAESVRFVRSYKDELPVLRELLPHIETPVQIITGDHDPGVLPVNGEYLHELLAHNKHDYLNAGHFAWADAADDYSRLLIEWWNGGYERV